MEKNRKRLKKERGAHPVCRAPPRGVRTSGCARRRRRTSARCRTPACSQRTRVSAPCARVHRRCGDVCVYVCVLGGGICARVHMCTCAHVCMYVHVPLKVCHCAHTWSRAPVPRDIGR
eukprot:658591-Rhodomonas_salina.1